MQKSLPGLGMESSGQDRSVNPIVRGEGIFLPISSTQSERSYVQFLETLAGSPDPRTRALGRQARKEYLEEKEKLEAIPITPYDTLSNKSREVSTRLRDALMSENNPGPSVTSQLHKPIESSPKTFRAGLSSSQQDKYDRIINLLDQSTDSGSIDSAQVLSLTDRPQPLWQSPLHLTPARTMATIKKDKKLKVGAKMKSDGWTLDSQDLRVLSDERLSELSLNANIHNVTLRNLESAKPSSPPEGCIILPTAVISAGIPIPLPREVCQVIKSLGISPAQLSPNAFRTLVGTLALFKLNGHRVPTPERFQMIYQVKDNHNSVGIYSINSWASGNLVIGNPDSEKNWKEELVVVKGRWFAEDTMPAEVPPTSFGLAKHWKKPSFESYDKVLIQELGFLAQLPVLRRHWKVLLSWKALVKCRFLSSLAPETPGIAELDPFEPDNLHEAVRDLGGDNKRNRTIRDSLQKSICHVEDVIPGAQVVSSMPTVAEIENIPDPVDTTDQGTM